MKVSKLLRNGLLYTVGGLLLQGVNFFTLPIFTRLLSVENYISILDIDVYYF